MEHLLPKDENAEYIRKALEVELERAINEQLTFPIRMALSCDEGLVFVCHFADPTKQVILPAAVPVLPKFPLTIRTIGSDSKGKGLVAVVGPPRKAN